MKRTGNVTTFEHITGVEQATNVEQRAVFLAQFDGQWDVWVSQKTMPTMVEVDACLNELGQYYQLDWGGTGRLIPVLYVQETRQYTIDCM